MEDIRTLNTIDRAAREGTPEDIAKLFGILYGVHRPHFESTSTAMVAVRLVEHFQNPNEYRPTVGSTSHGFLPEAPEQRNA